MAIDVKTTKKIETVEVRDVKILRAYKFDKGRIGFAMVINGVYINGCTVVPYNNDYFISYPQQKGKDGKYYNICSVTLSKDDEKAIIQAVINQAD